jgi:4-aminobutyrate aminotransferase-like enzyme
VFFAVSESEANEAAVQFAREYTGARKVLTRYRSYHGATYGAGSLIGDPETRNPFLHSWIEDGDNPVFDVVDEAQSRGVLVGGGRPKTQLVVAPPLPVTDAE